MPSGFSVFLVLVVELPTVICSAIFVCLSYNVVRTESAILGPVQKGSSRGRHASDEEIFRYFRPLHPPAMNTPFRPRRRHRYHHHQ